MVEAVIDILKADNTLVSLVGMNSTGEKAKIYPVIAPQKEKASYITVRQTGKVKIAKGCSYQGSFATFTYHENYDDCKAIDLAIVEVMEAVNANEGVSFIHLTGTSDDFVFQGEGGGGLYSRVSTFDCTYDEDNT